MNITEIIQRTRTILGEVGALSGEIAELSDAADLYEAGLTSRASVNVMLALEDEFDIEFPDHMLNRHMFQSILAISNGIESIVNEDS